MRSETFLTVTCLSPFVERNRLKAHEETCRKRSLAMSSMREQLGPPFPSEGPLGASPQLSAEYLSLPL
jgi:hypothetical protein